MFSVAAISAVVSMFACVCAAAGPVLACVVTIVVMANVVVVVVAGNPGVRWLRALQVQGMPSPLAESIAGMQSNKQLAQY
jgi:hypothetical protein